MGATRDPSTQEETPDETRGLDPHSASTFDDDPIVILPDEDDERAVEAAAPPPPAPPVSPPPGKVVRIVKRGPPAPAPVPMPAQKRSAPVAPAPKTNAPPAARAVDPRSQALEQAQERLHKHDDAEIDQEVADERATRRHIAAPWLFRVAAWLVVGLLFVLFLAARDYYFTPLAKRALHHWHHWLRPSGTLGLTLAIGGTLLMLSSLLYVLRKSRASWQRLGSLRDWLGVHTLAGLVGPALILFHAAFLPTSAMGLVGLCAMVIVVSSGLVGRHFLSSVPKTVQGKELEFETIRRRLSIYREKLLGFGLDPKLLPIDAKPAGVARSPWLVKALFVVLWGDRQGRKDFARLRKAVQKRQDLYVEMERVLILARKLCLERQALLRYRELKTVVAAWRFFHLWFTVVLFVGVAYHVAVALKFGALFSVPFSGGGR